MPLWNVLGLVLLVVEAVAHLSDRCRLRPRTFDGVGARRGDYDPVARRAEIDTINARGSLLLVNPTGILPVGPDLTFDMPNARNPRLAERTTNPPRRESAPAKL